MKKGMAMILVAALVVSMTACGGQESSKSEDETIVLRILENDTAKQKGYLDELLNAFNEAYKDKGIQAVDANME